MIAAALLPAALALGAATPPAAARLEAELSPSLAFRRLLAADDGVPRREAHGAGMAFAYDERGGDEPEIVIDQERVRGLPPGEAEAEYARALARAAIAAPVPLAEAEQAVEQWTAQALAEAAAEDPALSKALREAVSASRAPVLSRAADFLTRFERDPREAYWAVESGAGLPGETVRLTDLEDLFASHAAEIRALREPPTGPYGQLGGRRYPGPRVRAAFRLRALGEIERLRESLGAYDTVGVASFRDAIRRWRRGPVR